MQVRKISLHFLKSCHTSAKRRGQSTAPAAQQTGMKSTRSRNPTWRVWREIWMWLTAHLQKVINTFSVQVLSLLFLVLVLLRIPRSSGMPLVVWITAPSAVEYNYWRRKSTTKCTQRVLSCNAVTKKMQLTAWYPCHKNDLARYWLCTCDSTTITTWDNLLHRYILSLSGWSEIWELIT